MRTHSAISMGSFTGFWGWTQAFLPGGLEVKPIWLAVLLVGGISSMSVGQAKEQYAKRVILPNVQLVRCISSDCFRLLQDEPPRPGDIYPEHIDVAFLDRWCPFGLTARYNKAVSYETLRDALEKRYGKGTSENWPTGPAMIWEVKSAHVSIDLVVANKQMAENQHVEEGTKSVHYDDMSGKLCPVRPLTPTATR